MDLRAPVMLPFLLALAATWAAVPPAAFCATPSAESAPVAKPPSEATPKAPTVLRGGRGRACLLRNNAVRCWGQNSQGVLGDGTQISRDAAVPVRGLPKGQILDLVVTDSVACVLYAKRQPWCWGAYNVPSQRGFLPTKLSGFQTRPIGLALGDNHQCGVSPEGGVTCVGKNYSAALGHPKQTFAGIFKVPLPEPATSVFGLSNGTCATLKSGKTFCWGRAYPGLYGALKGPCFGRSVGVGCSPTPTPAAAPVTPVSLVENSGDVCLLESSGNVSCVLNRVLYRDVASGVVEMVLGKHICVRLHDGGVKCSSRRADVCVQERGRRRCRATLRNGPNWAAAFTPLAGERNAVSIGAFGNKVCVARRSGEVSCHGFDRKGETAELIRFPEAAALDKTRKARLAALSALKEEASEDLFKGALWLAQDGAGETLVTHNSIKIAVAMAVAGRLQEATAMVKGQLNRMGSELDALYRQGDCNSAVALALIPGDWKYRSLEGFILKCGRNLSPERKAKLVAALESELGNAAGQVRARLHRRLAQLSAVQGDLKRAIEHASNDTGSRYKKDIATAIRLGYGSGYAADVNKLVSGLDAALSNLAQESTGTVKSGRGGAPARAIRHAFDKLLALAPAKGLAEVSSKDLARWRALAFKILGRHSMSDLHRADLGLKLLAATPKGVMKRSEVKKRLSQATGWAVAGLKQTQTGRQLSDVAMSLVKAHSVHGKAKSLVKLAERWGPQLSRAKIIVILSKERAFKAAMAVAAAEANQYQQSAMYSTILGGALAEGDCKAVEQVLKHLLLVTQDARRIVTLSERCPKSLVAVAGLDDPKHERAEARGVILASQGRWREALQASAHLFTQQRTETWAYIAVFWERAGRPSLAHLKPVIAAVLE